MHKDRKSLFCRITLLYENRMYTILAKTAKKYGLIVNDDEWWHYIDSRIVKFGTFGNSCDKKFLLSSTGSNAKIE